MSIKSGRVVRRHIQLKTGMTAGEKKRFALPTGIMYAIIFVHVTFTVTTTGGTPTGTLNGEGAANMIKNMWLTGRGDASIIKPISGPVWRFMTYLKTGILPVQEGLAASISSTPGTQTASVLLPILFMDPSNVLPMQTCLDTNNWGALNLEFETHTDPSTYLYPDFAGGGTIAVSDFEFDISCKHVLQAPESYGTVREYWRSAGYDDVAGTATAQTVNLPENVELKDFIMRGTDEVISTAPVSSEGVVDDYNLFFGDVQFDKVNETKLRREQKLYLNEISDYPAGYHVISSSEFDKENADSFSLGSNQGNKIEIDWSAATSTTQIEYYYRSIKTKDLADAQESKQA